MRVPITFIGFRVRVFGIYRKKKKIKSTTYTKCVSSCKKYCRTMRTFRGRGRGFEPKPTQLVGEFCDSNCVNVFTERGDIEK